MEQNGQKHLPTLTPVRETPMRENGSDLPVLVKSGQDQIKNTPTKNAGRLMAALGSGRKSKE